MYSKRLSLMLTKYGYFKVVQNPRLIYNIAKMTNCIKNTDSRIYSSCNKKFDSPTGMPGSGAGKGGGGGGSVRESGGKFGEYGAAQEEHYFFNKQKEQLEKMKKKPKSDKAGEMTRNEEK